MTLRSKPDRRADRCRSGDTVGYGNAFTADAPLPIGVVACGYADGYPRHAPNGTPVLVDGVRTRVVGQRFDGHDYRRSRSRAARRHRLGGHAVGGRPGARWAAAKPCRPADRRGRARRRHDRLRADVRDSPSACPSVCTTEPIPRRARHVAPNESGHARSSHPDASSRLHCNGHSTAAGSSAHGLARRADSASVTRARRPPDSRRNPRVPTRAMMLAAATCAGLARAPARACTSASKAAPSGNAHERRPSAQLDLHVGVDDPRRDRGDARTVVRPPASSSASARAKWSSPAFCAQYAALPAIAHRPRPTTRRARGDRQRSIRRSRAGRSP